jgi:hypothetical protein
MPQNGDAAMSVVLAILAGFGAWCLLSLTIAAAWAGFRTCQRRWPS